MGAGTVRAVGRGASQSSAPLPTTQSSAPLPTTQPPAPLPTTQSSASIASTQSSASLVSHASATRLDSLLMLTISYILGGTEQMEAKLANALHKPEDIAYFTSLERSARAGALRFETQYMYDVLKLYHPAVKRAFEVRVYIMSYILHIV